MKLCVTLSLVGALLCAPAWAEEKIAIEGGSGIHWSKSVRDAWFVRYSNELKFPSYPEQEGFYEISLGDWNGKYPNTAVGLAVGARVRWQGFHLDGSVGVAYAENKTFLSNTHQEFILRYGLGYTVGKFDFGVYETHYSNARVIFGWDGKNVGYDFLTFQIGYVLK